MASIFSRFPNLAKWFRPSRVDDDPGSRQHDTLRPMAEQAGDAIFRFGADGRARYISRSAERLFG